MPAKRKKYDPDVALWVLDGPYDPIRHMMDTVRTLEFSIAEGRKEAVGAHESTIDAIFYCIERRLKHYKAAVLSHPAIAAEVAQVDPKYPYRRLVEGATSGNELDES